MPRSRLLCKSDGVSAGTPLPLCASLIVGVKDCVTPSLNSTLLLDSKMEQYAKSLQIKNNDGIHLLSRKSLVNASARRVIVCAGVCKVSIVFRRNKRETSTGSGFETYSWELAIIQIQMLLIYHEAKVSPRPAKNFLLSAHLSLVHPGHRNPICLLQVSPLSKCAFAMSANA